MRCGDRDREIDERDSIEADAWHHGCHCQPASDIPTCR